MGAKFGEPGYNSGTANPAYRNSQEYAAIHAWVKRRLPKPSHCAMCQIKPPVDMANISGSYSRELNDWHFLCRKCHMDSDGRNKQLVRSGKSRRIGRTICPYCDRLFWKKTQAAKYCSRDCYSNDGGRWAT